jgi:hypothetical protein
MIYTATQIITAGNQAITTADGKQQLRVDYAATADNTEIDNMIKTATKQVEDYTNRICMPTIVVSTSLTSRTINHFGRSCQTVSNLRQGAGPAGTRNRWDWPGVSTERR